MAVPKYYEFFQPIIQCLKDGNSHSMRELRDFCCKFYNLTEQDLQLTTPNGKQNLFYDRVSWAKTYLKKAGLIESTSRAQYCLTNAGKEAIADGIQNITLSYLKKYESFRIFIGMDNANKENGTLKEEKAAESPKEIIESSVKQINQSLSDNLMQEVLKMEWYDFEKLVVLLLKKMGYGEPTTTQKTGDGGIDGLVKADKFGFDTIYVQAKQWKTESTVSRPEIQKFLGALAGQGASKGLFITTAKFSNEAVQFAQRHLQQKIVLVDGEALTALMIEYNLGVSIETTYEIKRMDYDFFNEDF